LLTVASNLQGNYAVSGGIKGIEEVEKRAKPEFKARMAVRLAVAGAFHTDFMAPAVPKLEEVLAKTEIKTPRIPVVSNVDAKPHSDPETIKKILARQVGIEFPGPVTLSSTCCIGSANSPV
jgi:[acyl-carrier-protein] S-malonyltransferase